MTTAFVLSSSTQINNAFQTITTTETETETKSAALNYSQNVINRSERYLMVYRSYKPDKLHAVQIALQRL
jgi:hypothetical protein